jgi:hypothetical protein
MKPDSEVLRRGNIIEIAVRNESGSVIDYTNHWEARTLKAEARVVELEGLLREVVCLLRTSGYLRGSGPVAPIRPRHGNCCTCQDCGQAHDECVCESNEWWALLGETAQKL